MPRIELPDDGWADLYDADELPERLRRPLIKLAGKLMGSPVGAAMAVVALARKGEDVPPDLTERAQELGEADTDTLDTFKDSLILSTVREWSYGEVTSEVLLGLPARKIYDALFDASPSIDDLMSDFSPSPDEESPTGPSSA